jgi:hypothetical protein
MHERKGHTCWSIGWPISLDSQSVTSSSPGTPPRGRQKSGDAGLARRRRRVGCKDLAALVREVQP